MLADRLAAERLLVTYVARGRELAQRARDDVLRHRRRPHRLHQQGRHQHVAAEVGREVRQPGHQLLPRAEQLHAAHFALEPPEPIGMGRIAADGLGETAEIVVEDLGARQRRQGRGVRGHADPEADDAAGGPADPYRASPDRGHRLPSVPFQREPEVGLAVEAHLFDAHDPGGVAVLLGDPGQKPRTQRARGLHAEQGQVPRALGPRQLRDMVDQLRQLGLRKWRGVERQGVASRVLKVALHPHRAEQQEAECDGGRGFEPVGNRPRASRRAHDRAP